ncbi:hypothetical protein [Streptomyces sp. NPDC127098]|uniref:hypothetical protein n=1 Tax=Streptomyces sp. NPDC127098 TaxID=3347137 RepID=UPI003649A04C
MGAPQPLQRLGERQLVHVVATEPRSWEELLTRVPGPGSTGWTADDVDRAAEAHEGHCHRVSLADPC